MIYHCHCQLAFLLNVVAPVDFCHMGCWWEALVDFYNERVQYLWVVKANMIIRFNHKYNRERGRNFIFESLNPLHSSPMGC